jgi:hypothetical protein
LPLYIGRAKARELHAPDDPDVDDSHVFQGDVFYAIELMVRRPGGAAEWPLSWAIVISHHCEWTKAKKRAGLDYPILVAPLRRFDSFTPGDQKLIRGNQMRAYMRLPAEAPIDHDLAVDLRLIQPIAAADLAGTSAYVTSLGPELGSVLQAKVVEFIVRDRTLI